MNPNIRQALHTQGGSTFKSLADPTELTDPSDNYVTVAMATIPERKEHMLAVVERLLPQCNRMCITLNRYTEVPRELHAWPKVTAVCAGPGQLLEDRMAVGKFYWMDTVGGYYFTVDDDIIYPRDYIAHLTHKIERYERKAVVGVHGLILHLNGVVPETGEIPDYRKHRHLFVFKNGLRRDTPVHAIGTATFSCHTSTLKAAGFSWRDIAERPYSIDEQLARYCQRKRIPMLVTSRPQHWLCHNSPAAHTLPLNKRAEIVEARNRRYYEQQKACGWKLYRWSGGVIGE